MKYVIIAKRYHLGLVTDAYRRCYISKQRALEDYVRLMEDEHWTNVTAEVLRDGRYISIIETEAFLYEGNQKYLSVEK